MHKTSVYLNDAERERLAWLARREGKSRAEIIREAISAYVPGDPEERPWPSIDGCASVEGVSARDIWQEDDPLRGFGES